MLKSSPVERKDELLAVILSALGVQTDGTAAPDYRLMTWDQAREMKASGLIEFGAHSVHHEVLSRCSSARMKQEVVESCKTVQQMLGVRDLCFAYPNGTEDDFNSKTINLLREFGAVCAVSTIKGLNGPKLLHDDLFRLRRISIGCSMTQAAFALHTSGFVESARRFRPGQPKTEADEMPSVSVATTRRTSNASPASSTHDNRDSSLAGTGSRVVPGVVRAES